MLLSVDWLKDYLSKGTVKMPLEKLAHKMTMRGLAVAGIRSSNQELDSVVAGKIVEIAKHENADKLQVTQVVTADGDDAPKHQIVCGAKNIAVGDLVAVALPGTELPEMKIKATKIRGVASGGMLCSEKELGLSTEDSEGILQLPKHAKLGEPLSTLLGSHGGEELLEFELTANRGDCLSIIGLSREIAPVLKAKPVQPKAPKFKTSAHRTSNIIRVEVDDDELCPRYVAHVIDSLKVEQSPEWIQKRIQSVGIRPINNIVDITNFVMFEFGQPLHAFDLRRIESGGVRVEACKTAQPFTLLNGETVDLEPGDILIMDGDRPVALAGIMGGENSQIQEDTTSILLESAAFNAAQIRKTARRLGIISDSSRRFERGVDINQVLAASERAASLLRECFQANVYHPPLDTNDSEVEEKKISVDMRDVRRIIGRETMVTDEASAALESIGIKSQRRSTNILTVSLPSYRNDLHESIDIIEEIARLIGYDKIPTNTPKSVAQSKMFQDAEHEYYEKIRRLLSSYGLKETIHYSFTSRANLQQYGAPLENLAELSNPISEEMKVMRTSLLPSLLENYKYNKNRKTLCQRIFEIGKVYEWDESQETKVNEHTMAAALMAGTRRPTNWQEKTPDVDFFFAKGLLELLLCRLTKDELTCEPLKDHKLFHPARSSRIKVGNDYCGFLGEIHPYVRKEILDTDEPIVLFEIDVDKIFEHERRLQRFNPISKFPEVSIDIALVVDKAVASKELRRTMKEVAGDLLHDVSIFDVYEGENIPFGKKSLAFRLAFQSADRTLRDDEVQKLRDDIIAKLSSEHQAQVR